MLISMLEGAFWCSARLQAHQAEAGSAKTAEQSAGSDARGLEQELEEINGKLKKLQAEQSKLAEREHADTQLIQVHCHGFSQGHKIRCRGEGGGGGGGGEMDMNGNFEKLQAEQSKLAAFHVNKPTLS